MLARNVKGNRNSMGLDDRFNVIPEVAGRLFTGPPPAKQLWAQILASNVVSGVTLYTWQEMTPYLQTLIPLTGGMSGDALLNPLIEINGQALTIGSFVKVQPAYFDSKYDTVYYAIGVVGSASPGTGHKLLDILYRVSNVTYTPNPSATLIIVEVLGDGGGGGGCVASGAGTATAGGGGGGGGFARSIRNPINDGPVSLVVGSGGAGGANTGADGAAGTGSSYAGATVSASGGAGGKGCNAAAATAGFFPGGGGGGFVAGDIGAYGRSGDNGIVLAGGFSIAGNGGSGAGPYGSAGGQPAANGNAANGNVQGGGGSGAYANAVAGNGAKPGGNGAQGLITIWEYS